MLELKARLQGLHEIYKFTKTKKVLDAIEALELLMHKMRTQGTV